MEQDEPRDVTAVVFSFVVPVHNEAEGLEAFYAQLRDAADALAEPYEIIFVNDGSTDGSLDIIRGLQAEDDRIKYIDLSRNFGHQEALTAGYDFARGAAVITLDADGQHPTEVIAELVRRWRQGYEVVYTVKKADPNVSTLRRLAVRWVYRLIRWLSGMDVTDQADFRLLDRKAVEALRRTRERSRFLRGLVRWLGFRQVAVEYEPAPRQAGVPSYTSAKLARMGSAGVFNFSVMPLRCIGLLGGVMSVGAVLYGLGALLCWPFLGAAVLANLVALAVGLTGLVLGALGLVGEYIGRIYEEAKERPIYIVREAVGFEAEPTPASPAPEERPARQVPPAKPSQIRLFT